MSDITPAYFRNSNDSLLDDLVGTIIDAETSTPSRKNVQCWDYESRRTPDSPLEVAVWLDSQAQSLRRYKNAESTVKPVRSKKPTSSCSTGASSSLKSANSKASRSNLPVPVRKSSRSASMSFPPGALPEDISSDPIRNPQTRHQRSSRPIETWTPELEPVSSVVRNLALALQAISNEQALQHTANSSLSNPMHEAQLEETSSKSDDARQSIGLQSPARPSTSTEQIISGKFLEPQHSLFEINTSVLRSPPSNLKPQFGTRPLDPQNGPSDAVRDSSGDTESLAESTSAWTLLVGLYSVAFIISVDRVAVTTVIPHITEAFASLDGQAWYGSAYLLMASVSQPLYNQSYISFDTKWTFLSALLMFGIGSLVSGSSSSTIAFVCGRGIQGVGSAGALAGCSVVANESKLLQTRSRFFVGFHAVFGIGALIGPLLGGVFTDALTWRWTFWMNLPVTTIGFIIVILFFTPRAVATGNRSWIKRLLELDLTGASVLVTACVMLFLAFQLSTSHGNWTNSSCVGLLCGSCVAVMTFGLWLTYRGEKALVPPRVILHRNVAISCTIAFLTYGTIFVHAFYLPVWFQFVQGNSTVQSGVYMIPYILFSTAFYLLAGFFVSKFGFFALPAALGTVIGSVGAGLLTTLENTTTGVWVGYQIVVSLGIGMAIQHSLVAIQATLPPPDISIATAAVVGCQSLGGALFVSIGNTVLQYQLARQTQSGTLSTSISGQEPQQKLINLRSAVAHDQPSEAKTLYSDSLKQVFIIAIPLCLCAFLCSLFLERGWERKSRSDEQDSEPTA